MKFDVSTFLLQWAMGGLAFLWVTSRWAIVSIGYRWLLYGVWGSVAALAAGAGFARDTVLVRDAAGIAVVCAAIVVVGISVRDTLRDRRAESKEYQLAVRRKTGSSTTKPISGKLLDIWAPSFGLVGLVGAGFEAEGPVALVRVIVGALFLGAVTDTMLLGHWYLVQPGMSRAPLTELIAWGGVLCLADAAVWLLPTGLLSAGTDSLLVWFWLVCAVATAWLLLAARLALREPRYSAVMAATGLSYLAVMTSIAMELVAGAAVF